MAFAITQRRKQWVKNGMTIFLFLLPALAVYFTYTLAGIIRTFYYSVFNWSGIGPASQAANVGLGNYVKLMGDAGFWHALQNNVLLVIVSIVFQLSFGMILALILNTSFRGVRALRTIYFMPLLLSTVATGTIWLMLYAPYTGLFDGLLKIISPNVPLSWLGSEQVVMPAVMFVICWQYTPQYMILLRAGMTGIPDELYEAATIDGASRWQQFWRMTLPLLSGTIKTSAVLSIVGSLKYFDLIWIMTLGGPNGYSELMATFMYKKAFNEDRMGYASTVASCMVIISFVVIGIFRYMTRSKEETNHD
ncbi:putative ABC transporter permease protein YurN [Spirochaetia bacterium]|nr:putative ABC transporter permease protein YurN [Spirochaetia bacterium]